MSNPFDQPGRRPAGGTQKREKRRYKSSAPDKASTSDTGNTSPIIPTSSGSASLDTGYAGLDIDRTQPESAQKSPSVDVTVSDLLSGEKKESGRSKVKHGKSADGLSTTAEPVPGLPPALWYPRYLHSESYNQPSSGRLQPDTASQSRSEDSTALENLPNDREVEKDSLDARSRGDHAKIADITETIDGIYPVQNSARLPSKSVLPEQAPSGKPRGTSLGKSTKKLSDGSEVPAKGRQFARGVVNVVPAYKNYSRCLSCQVPVNDGHRMICCDLCNLWMHYQCSGVNLTKPKKEEWYCASCSVLAGLVKFHCICGSEACSEEERFVECNMCTTWSHARCVISDDAGDKFPDNPNFPYNNFLCSSCSSRPETELETQDAARSLMSMFRTETTSLDSASEQRADQILEHTSASSTAPNGDSDRTNTISTIFTETVNTTSASSTTGANDNTSDAISTTEASVEDKLGLPEEAPGEALEKSVVERSEPVTVEPVADEPVAVEPVADEPVAVEPVAVEPVAVEPVAVEPVAVEPVAVEPVAVEPVAVEPVAVEPVAVEPVAAEPVTVASATPPHAAPVRATTVQTTVETAVSRTKSLKAEVIDLTGESDDEQEPPSPGATLATSIDLTEDTFHEQILSGVPNDVLAARLQRQAAEYGRKWAQKRMADDEDTGPRSSKSARLG